MLKNIIIIFLILLSISTAKGEELELVCIPRDKTNTFIYKFSINFQNREVTSNYFIGKAYALITDKFISFFEPRNSSESKIIVEYHIDRYSGYMRKTIVLSPLIKEEIYHCKKAQKEF